MDPRTSTSTDLVSTSDPMEQLKNSVKEWLQIDSQIIKLRKAIKERQARKKELDLYILKIMENNEISHMNVGQNKLIYHKSTPYKSLTKKHLITSLSNYLNSFEEGEKLYHSIMNSREKIEKINLAKRKHLPKNLPFHSSS
tara:strand:+ start:166 stop:588 length:423 start_codon:yes stop_codon:yes gene_type:complete